MREQDDGHSATERTSQPGGVQALGDRQHRGPSRWELRIHLVGEVDDIQCGEELPVRRDRERESSCGEDMRLKDLNKFVDGQRSPGEHQPGDRGV